MSEIDELEIKSMTKEQNYIRGYKDGKSDVLDKIKAEIKENIESFRMADWETNNILADGLQMALNIIDGYREGESEC